MGSSYFRWKAREALKGKWAIAILTGLLFSVFGGNRGFSFNLRENDLKKLIEYIFRTDKRTAVLIISFVGSIALVAFIFSIALFLLGSEVIVGYSRFNLNLIDGKEPQINDLFSYFKIFWKTVLMNLLINIYIFFWSLLFIIPGIIAAYSYAMAPYIMAENPGINPNDAITQSKFMMQGRKTDLFILDLSFIGWVLLGILSCGIGFLWITPYMNASRAEFYNVVSGRTERMEQAFRTAQEPGNVSTPQ